MSENLENDQKNDNKSNIGILILCGIIFFPATILGFVLLTLLTKRRQKTSVIALYSTAIIFLSVIAWFIFNPLGVFVNSFSDPSTILKNMVPLYCFVNIFLGVIFGWVLIVDALRKLKNSPYKKEDPNSWMYHFKYNRAPWDKKKYKKTISDLKSGVLSSSERTALGIDEENDFVAYRYNSEATRHSLIVGASGSGKTITMLSLMRNDIKNGIPLFVIDFKHSPEFASKLAYWAKEYGSDFYHFVNGSPENYDIPNSDGQAFYDPLSEELSSTVKADMVLRMREYDTASAVYKANMTQILQIIFSMLYYADRSKAPSVDWNGGGIYQLASAITDGNLTELASACEGTPIQKQAEELDEASRGRSGGIPHALDELRGQIRTIIASEYGLWLKNRPNSRNIKLFDLSKSSKNIVLFSLDSDSEPEFAKYIGSLILMDMTTMSAMRRNNDINNQVSVYIDEFQAVTPESVKSLLEKSRESKIAMTLAQQSFEQIVASSGLNGEAYLRSILDTCSNFFIHAGSTQDSAERMSKILGKVQKQTYRTSYKDEGFIFSNNFTNRRKQTVQLVQEEQWAVPPRTFMELSVPGKANGEKSTAMIINKGCADERYYNKNNPGAVARKVWMIPEDSVLGDLYTPQARAEALKINKEKFAKKDTSIAIDEHDRNLLKSLADNDSYNGNDEEEDDGDFKFEKIQEPLKKEKNSGKEDDFQIDDIDDVYSINEENSENNIDLPDLFSDYDDSDIYPDLNKNENNSRRRKSSFNDILEQEKNKHAE